MYRNDTGSEVDPLGTETESLAITVRFPKDDRPLIVVQGEIDVATSPQFRDAMLELIAQGHAHLLVHLGAVRYMDSSGLGALASALKRLRSRQGALVLVAPTDGVKRVLHVTRLDKIIRIYATEEEALKSLS